MNYNTSRYNSLFFHKSILLQILIFLDLMWNNNTLRFFKILKTFLSSENKKQKKAFNYESLHLWLLGGKYLNLRTPVQHGRKLAINTIFPIWFFVFLDLRFSLFSVRLVFCSVRVLFSPQQCLPCESCFLFGGNFGW